MINEVVFDEATNASFQELDEFNRNTFSQYYSRFIFYKSQLESLKNIDYMDFTSTDYTIMDQMKNQDDIRRKLLGFPSSKGGANILPKEVEKEIQDSIKKQKEYINNNLRQQIKDNIFKINSRNDLKMIMLNISRDIFKLKQEVTGITEKFIFSYTDSEKTIMKAMSVNVSDFFNIMLKNINNLSAFGLDKDSRTGATKIRFNKGSLISQLSKFINNGVDEIAIKDFINSSGERITAMDLYKKLTSENTKGQFIVSKNRLTNTELKNNKFILREDNNYLVTRPYQTGFVAQGILEASINNTKFNYIQDTINLFAGEDFTSKNQKIGYSMKNLISANPSFFTIDSLITSVNQIVTILESGPNTISSIKNKLKDAIFSSDFNADSYFEDTMESIMPAV